MQSLAAAGWPRVAGILAEEVKERLHFDDDDARAQVLPAAAVRAVLQVDVKDTLEQPCPADALHSTLGGFALAVSSCCSSRLFWLRGPLRHHQRPHLRVCRQHPVEPDQVQARSRISTAKRCMNSMRRHHQVRGAVTPRRLELQLHLPGGVALRPLVGQRRASDVPA